MSAKREAEVSQLRAVAAGRFDAVRWSFVEGGHRCAGFPALGVAVAHGVWKTSDRRLEYGDVVTRASRSVWVERSTDPYAALAALARLALDMAGADGVDAWRPGGAALRVVGLDAPRVAVAVPTDGGTPLRPAG